MKARGKTSGTAGERALVEAAIAARSAAYAPYSGFKVGAALLLKDGRVVTGVNVENASYGLTTCAERNACAAAVSAGAGPGDVRFIAIAASAEEPTPPCGACRQVLAEFGDAETGVLLHNVKDGEERRFTLAELLPHAFLRASLPRP